MKFYSFIVIAILTAFFVFSNAVRKQNLNNKSHIRTSGTGKAMNQWFFERAYPNEKIPNKKWKSAFEQKQKMNSKNKKILEGSWESMGPNYLAGRTLCLAFHPSNENVIFAGSASGGLWKTSTQGEGQNAWHFVPTGFPTLGVGSIAIDQTNPELMYIGTGEVYGAGFAEPGTVNRLTRGSYGIGVLKSEDGGDSWQQVLPFDEENLVGVFDLAINPQNSQIVFASTTNGVYRTQDGGDTWELKLNQPDCFDLEIDPNNGNVVYVTQGNFNYNLISSFSGIYKSTNGGDTFSELLDSGLIAAWSGNARLSIDPNNSNTIYASIQVGWFNTGTTTPAGIYKSNNAGANWSLINNQNITLYQGWYSHDFAINPLNNNEMIYTGVDLWKSTNTGSSFTKKSDWSGWGFGEIPFGEPNSSFNFLHGDIHAVYYHPLNNSVFIATDGGIFKSENGEPPYTPLNGGLQTMQFYANMASSATNPDYFMAGAQDNSTYEYRGTENWWRVIGGDGMSTAVNQSDDQIVYGSWQGLNIMKSTNGGDSFFNAKPTLVSGDYSAFSAPYELAPTNQEIMYAGARYLYKSTNAGSNWNATSGSPVDGANMITNIAISYSNPDLIYVTTSPDPFQGPSSAKVKKSSNGGQSFSTLSGLPNRIAKDIEFDPNDDNILYVTFSGFGTNHVYKTINGGDDWFAVDNGLPDLPTNTVLIDPSNSDFVYVGNDLGVFFSDNGGDSWEDFNEELPEATMVYDLNYSPANNKVRIATHGHGIYQRDLVTESEVAVTENTNRKSKFSIYPNPALDYTTIKLDVSNNQLISIYIINTQGKKIRRVFEGHVEQGLNTFSIDQLSDFASGHYLIQVKTSTGITSKQLIID